MYGVPRTIIKQSYITMCHCTVLSWPGDKNLFDMLSALETKFLQLSNFFPILLNILVWFGTPAREQYNKFCVQRFV